MAVGINIENNIPIYTIFYLPKGDYTPIMEDDIDKNMEKSHGSDALVFHYAVISGV